MRLVDVVQQSGRIEKWKYVVHKRQVKIYSPNHDCYLVTIRLHLYKDPLFNFRSFVVDWICNLPPTKILEDTAEWSAISLEN